MFVIENESDVPRVTRGAAKWSELGTTLGIIGGHPSAESVGHLSLRVYVLLASDRVKGLEKGTMTDERGPTGGEGLASFRSNTRLASFSVRSPEKTQRNFIQKVKKTMCHRQDANIITFIYFFWINALIVITGFGLWADFAYANLEQTPTSNSVLTNSLRNL